MYTDYSNHNNIRFKALPVPKQTVNLTRDALLDKNVHTINIYCHNSADEDTFNSAKVFGNWLIKHRKKVNICVQPNEIADLYLKNCKAAINTNYNKSDKILIVDFNAKERMPNAAFTEEFNTYKPDDIYLYDHHNKNANTVNGNLYIDTTAKSNCSIIKRFFEGLGEKLGKNDTKSLYCGMISDFKKSGLVQIAKDNKQYKLIKTDKLYNDKNSLELINKLESKLSEKDRVQIYKHLDPLSRLNKDEQEFRKGLFHNIPTSPNGKMAYVVIEPDNKLWAAIGMDNQKTSEILKDIRSRVSTDPNNMDELTQVQKNKLNKVNTVVAFYRANKNIDSDYKISIHSNNNTALDYTNYVKHINPLFDGGGHEDRAGGSIHSINKNDTHQLINDFIKASETLN